MNIFFLDPDPRESARLLVDCHVVKMPLEAAQIAMTVFHLRGRDGWQDAFRADMGREPYRATHKHHPMVAWAAASVYHIYRLLDDGQALFQEYERRRDWGSQHGSWPVFAWCIDNVYRLDMPDTPKAPPPQCVPDEHKGPDLYAAYQSYYLAKLEAWANDPKRAHLVKGGIAG